MFGKELREELQQVALRAYGQESVESNAPPPSEMPAPTEVSDNEPAKNEEFSDDDIPF